MIETVSGIITALVIIILSRVLSKYFSVQLFATAILVAIAFIYVGFSLKNNPAELTVLEIMFALALSFFAIIGFTHNSNWIAYGIIIHGLWDIFHHNGFIIETDVPAYWPVFCIVIDIITGVYFLYVFNNQKNKSWV